MSETARRLAAIMAVDVAGYSRLMGEDEAGTARSVREHRDAARPIVAGHGGRIVKTMGDGVLLEFPSVVAAVECAIAVQRLMMARNQNVPEARRIVYRIGINLGDVLIEGDDILGDGVNIAARLEGISEPGGICLSGTAYEHVRGKVAVDFTDLGERDLKNIARPVRVYAISPFSVSSPSPPRGGGEGRDEVGDSRARITTLPSRAATRRGEEAAPRLSIVVLPFANLGGDPEQEYFVDGVTESLTTDLSRISDSFVIARNTAFTYKGKPIDVTQIGRDLNVRYVLEGSVQRRSNRLRVNVQLIDAETGSHLWAERFDKSIVDLFDMQDEIVARLANQLNVQLIAAEARRAERSPNPDSMDLYFQGMTSMNKAATPETMEIARDFFQRSLALDPNNVEALVGMARVDQFVAGGRISDDWAERLLAAEAEATKAVAITPNHAGALLVLGATHIFSNRASQGMAECERALALDPNLAAAHHYIGLAKLYLGRAEETEGHCLEALRLSPRDSNAHSFMSVCATSKLLLGRYEESVAWRRRGIEINRNYAAQHFYLAAALALLDRFDEAQSAVRQGLALDPSFTLARFRRNSASDNPTFLAQRERFIEGMRKAGVPEG